MVRAGRIGKWSVIYDKAIREDGSLFFPEKLNEEFLEDARRRMGPYLFANQYLNEVFPDEERKFRQEWFRYYNYLPEGLLYHFAFIDPAISKAPGSDFTGVVVVAVDHDGNWYYRIAHRFKKTPTEIIEMLFNIQNAYKCQGIGIETVAYQEALMYMAAEEMRRRNVYLPLQEVKRSNSKSKEARILSLVPRFEMGKQWLLGGMDDFEKELLQFPRSAHDDISDAAASIEEIVFYPEKERKDLTHVEPTAHSGDYESHLIRKYIQKANDELGE